MAIVVEIVIVKNEAFRIVASFGEAERLSIREVVPLDRSTVTGRAICDLQPVQVADLQSAGDEFPLGRELAIRHGHRTTLSVPLIREGRALDVKGLTTLLAERHARHLAGRAQTLQDARKPMHTDASTI